MYSAKVFGNDVILKSERNRWQFFMKNFMRIIVIEFFEHIAHVSLLYGLGV